MFRVAVAILFLLIAAAPTAIAATHSPDPAATVPAPAIVTSALPLLFANATFAYTLGSSQAANWSCGALCPYSTLLHEDPAYFASLRGDVPWNGSQTFSVKATMNGTAVWQNWTPSTLTNATVTSAPAFTVDPGVFYAYYPTIENPGMNVNWSFSGAPYLSLNNRTGEVSGLPTNTTASYVNLLNYTSSQGNWTQAWWTVPVSDNFPATITFDANTTGHFLNVTLPTSAVAAVGSDIVWLGQYPLIDLGLGTDNYTFAFSQPQAYNLTWTSGVTTEKNLWYFGAPGSTTAVTIDGRNLHLPILPSSGYDNTTLIPPAAVTGFTFIGLTPNSLQFIWANPVQTVADNIYWCYNPCTLPYLGEETVSSAPGSAGYLLRGLVPDTSYTICIGAVSLAGQGPTVCGTTTTRSLDPAIGFTVVTYGSFANSTWAIPVTATYTNQAIQVGGPGCTTFNYTFSIPIPRTWLNVSLPAGTYCFGLTLLQNASMSPTEYATVVVVAPTVGAPGPATNLTAYDILDNGTSLKWTASVNATRYEILYGTVCGRFTVSTLIGNVTTINITGLSPLTGYCFTIQALNGTVGSSLSNTATITTTGVPTNRTSPPPPANTTTIPPPVAGQIKPNLYWALAVIAAVVVLSVIYFYYDRRDRRGT